MNDPRALSPYRRFILFQIKNMGASLNEVSRRLGKNPSYLHQFLWKNSPKVLPEDVRKSLASFLGLPEIQLRAPFPRPGYGEPIAPERQSGSLRRAGAVGMLYWPSQRPAKSVVPGRRRAGFQQVVNTKTISIQVTSMAATPRYSSGDLLVLRQKIPVRLGDAVALDLEDGQFLLGTVGEGNADLEISWYSGGKVALADVDRTKLWREFLVLRGESEARR